MGSTPMIRITALLVLSLAFGASSLRAEDGAPTAAAASGTAGMVLAPFSDHYEMRVAKPADDVWRHVKRLYVDGERMRQQGFDVSRVTDDPTAWLGAVRGVRKDNPSRPEVTIKVSGVDDEARLLTLMIVLENPTPVHVVHQVRPDGPNAAIYQTIVLTQWPVRKPEGGALTADSIRQKMKADVAFHNAEVAEIMKREKGVIEALD